MSTEVVLAVIGGLVTIIGSFFGLVKMGYIQIGKVKNGNGHSSPEYLEKAFKQLAETANHNFTELTRTVAEHTAEDAREFGRNEEFREEVRDFMSETRSKKT